MAKIIESVLLKWVRLFHSKNCDTLAVFGQKLAARQKEKLHLTSFQPKGRRKKEIWGNQGLYQRLLVVILEVIWGFPSFGFLLAFCCLSVGAQFDVVLLVFQWLPFGSFLLEVASTAVFTAKSTLPLNVGVFIVVLNQ